MSDQEVMQMALDVLANNRYAPSIKETIEALRAALAQPEPDCEAEFIKDWNAGKVKRVSDGKRMVPEREWVGLTDQEIEEAGKNSVEGERMLPYSFSRAIEQALKEKNT
jgi:hypothetical protein